jgi:hypothetical protein
LPGELLDIIAILDDDGERNDPSRLIETIEEDDFDPIFAGRRFARPAHMLDRIVHSHLSARVAVNVQQPATRLSIAIINPTAGA